MARSGTEARFLPAALRALEAFGVEPRTVTLTWHSENLTFRAEGADGAVHALRLHREGHNSRAELEAEFAWVQALGEAGILTPERRMARDGGAVVEVPMATGETRFASLTRWMDGQTLHQMLEAGAEHPARAGHMARLGTMTARMHAHARDWRSPPGFVRRPLTLETLVGDAPAWGRFDRHPGLSLDERTVLTRARDNLRDRLSGMETGAHLIHGDLTLANVMIDGERLCLIDFDDAGFGSPLYDLGTLLFHLAEASDRQRCEAEFLDAYAAIEPLSDAALAMLEPMMLVRGLFMIGWFEQRPKLNESEAFAALKPLVLGQARAFLDGRS